MPGDVAKEFTSNWPANSSVRILNELQSMMTLIFDLLCEFSQSNTSRTFLSNHQLG